MIRRSIFFFMMILAISVSSVSIFVVRKSSAKPVAQGIPVPMIGATYTVQQLLNIINTNNPNKNSNFLVPVYNKNVVMNASCWSPTTDGRIANIDGSASVGTVGAQSIINANKNTPVIVKIDPVLIKHLQRDGRLSDETASKYSRILLWFELNGYRFYLNDPFPGKIIKTPAGSRNPALNIINKWVL